MKKIYSILIFLVLSAPAWGQPFKGEVEITCNALEEREETLYLDLDIFVDSRAMGVTQSWTIIPELTTGREGETRYFPRVLINGKNKRQMYERREKFNSTRWMAKLPYMLINVEPQTDTTANYVMEIPYEPWMDEARLVVRQILTSCRDQERLFTVNLATPVKLMVREPYEVQPQIIYITPEKELFKMRQIQAQAFLDFVVGKWDILPNFRRNAEELDKISRTLSGVRSMQDVEITGLFIEGYASPEGSFSSNQRLSTNRSESLRQYIAANYNISLSLMQSVGMGEDWGGLRQLVEESSIDYKSDILNLIDTDINPDTKEARIKLLGGGRPYQVMFREMYPQLRRVDYRVDFRIKQYNLEESRNMVDVDPTMLSQYELFELANSYEKATHEYDRIVDIMVRQYPDDEVANLNAAGAALERRDVTRARYYLERAGNSAEAMNNLGVILLLEGDIDGALAQFNRARSMGRSEAEHNIEEANRKQEDNILQERYKNR